MTEPTNCIFLRSRQCSQGQGSAKRQEQRKEAAYKGREVEPRQAPRRGSWAGVHLTSLEGLELSRAALPSPSLCSHLSVTPALALALIHLVLAFPFCGARQAAVIARSQDCGSWR